MVRELTHTDVEFTISCEPEHVRIEGNASAIDPKTDARIVRWIERQLERGNEWAWCSVKVTAKWKEFEGHDYLGCCSYRSEKDFRRPGGYYDDMKDLALEDLNNKLSHTAELLQQLS